MLRYDQALAAAVCEWGDHSQRARQDEGVLPLTEAETVVRDELFRTLDDLPRYDRLRSTDIEHDENCYQANPHYNVAVLTDLTAVQYETFAAVRKALVTARGQDDVRCEVRSHCGTCDACDGDMVYRRSVRAVIRWHHRDFSREYAVEVAS